MTIQTDPDQLVELYTEDVRRWLAYCARIWWKVPRRLMNDALNEGYVEMAKSWGGEKGWDPELDDFKIWASRCTERAIKRWQRVWNKAIPKGSFQPVYWDEFLNYTPRPSVNMIRQVAALNYEQKQVIKMHLAGATHTEIAKKLGISIEAVYSRLHRAKNSLLEKFREELYEEL